MSYFFIKKPALVVFLRRGAEWGAGLPGRGERSRVLVRGALGLPALWGPPQGRGHPLPLLPGSCVPAPPAQPPDTAWVPVTASEARGPHLSLRLLSGSTG